MSPEREGSPLRPLVVVMGVSGAGKTTVGRLLAERLGVSFIDGDDLHPPANVAKMASGVPLTDDDRFPWLESVGGALAGSRAGGAVVACSALKRTYREIILAEAPDLLFVELHAAPDLIVRRLEARTGHFMPGALFDSQWNTLEPLEADEPGFRVDCTHGPDRVVADLVDELLSQVKLRDG
ncbi:gluconokinase [Nonomuraea sp. NPDC050153]|uniref:gluconokinase n=1 Tax=Nonomuraea sp. NPDC050153 TaxID=3364359 RepID=UPI0037AAAB8B